MARELYNITQENAYLRTAIIKYNEEHKNNEIIMDDLVNDFIAIHSQIGKEGIEGYINYLLKKN